MSLSRRMRRRPKPEPELDRSPTSSRRSTNNSANILWTDADRVRRMITKRSRPEVAADRAYQNAMTNTDMHARSSSTRPSCES